MEVRHNPELEVLLYLLDINVELGGLFTSAGKASANRIRLRILLSNHYRF